ncbi:MAG: acetylornithine/succinylornithine family transaminase [Vicinamibacterales bacterium]|nr:acetylornithine/succinylornithine family transaminase [Vicinamibacterales bacterium]
MTTKDILETEAAHILQTYKRAPIVLSRGKGVHLFDDAGQEYTDLLSGIGVASLGHAHPGLAAAIADQAATLVHTSNLYFHPLQGQLAARLAELSGLPRAFFCNSGSEAVEACLKFARRYWHTKGDTARTEIVALEQSFHGRTLGALSTTWQPSYRTPFQPLVPGVTFVAAEADALTTAISATTQAVIVEPLQGEGGIRPLPPEVARALQQACDDTGALLIADEVQCGLGRTGRPFYFQALDLRPDLISVGKALGAGFPVGAALVGDRVAAAVAYGDHGSTYGGNLLACRAALVFLEELMDHGLLNHVRTVGAIAQERLRALADRHPAITDVRGAGVMWGIEVDAEAAEGSDAAAVAAAALDRRLLVNRTAGNVVRLLPPLTITADEFNAALDTLDASFDAVLGGAS